MKSVLFAVAIIILNHSIAQDYPREDINLEKLVDEIFPLQDLDLNYGELYENLAQLLSQPLDLNTATGEQLRSLFVINEEQINTLIHYREENGPLLSVYELQSLPGWERSTFDTIIPFVMVVDSQSKLNASILRRIGSEKNNYLLLRYGSALENKRGYHSGTDSSQRYIGSPANFYMRYRIARSNDFSIGFTAEKDAGEKMNWSPSQRQYGFDFTSWHIALQNKGRIKNLVLGDFQSQFGQGLILGSVFGFGKNAETVTTVRRSNLGFLPYTSISENLFFRGAAISCAVGRHLILHGFASHTFKDGNVDRSNDDNLSISSFPLAGLHRTPAELGNRQQVGEVDEGVVLQVKSQFLDGGVIYHQTFFDHPVIRNPRAYNQFTFNGSENKNGSVYLNFSWANFTFFSEFAQTFNHGRAVTAGILGNITHQLELSLLCRNFAKDFYSFNSNAFSENTVPQNERGIYWGWKYLLGSNWSVSGYVDLFQFPWLRYRGYSPSDGNEWLLRLNFRPSKAVLFFLQAREESKIRNLPAESTLYRSANGVKRNYWISCDYATPPFTFKTRAQLSSYELDGRITHGIALVHDMSLALKRCSLTLRYALFDTDDYDTRLYFYERDVWLAYSFPAYSGVGVRTYVLAQYKLSQKVDLWFRWSQVRYTDRVEIGSGSETIAGNSGNDVKFQVRIQF